MTDIKRIALFVTCIVDQTMPEVGVATVRLLRRAGFEVDFPQAQTCCGQPFFNSGYRDQARDLARRTVELLDPYEAIVLPSGSCTAMIRLEYPHLLEGNPRWYYAAKRVAAKTYELSEFLGKFAPDFLNNEQLAMSNEQVAITYHDSCHMNRMLGIKDAPRTALAAAGYEIDDMTESDRCCGFGGLFSIKMPEVSNAMTAEKIRQGKETAVHTIVTADPGCLMQMRGMVQEGDGVEVKHLAVALDEALGRGAGEQGNKGDGR
ncbi:MAG: (Fe-S)-binding protein [Ardenticatenaceae bacterium]|nr:(Fe-S)-binding protein [Anaerolineales bacterium]MCB8923898.1 (Fe-S)-binding protein [Ardenticatenaceae bacterium]MCB8990457.1 (Fe-S)-binding protein [Ardenticatenaceae bacterium]MCB9003471.1 (Fe-S)-binding protein [Ardenticatenaceae bacterium]